MGRPRSVCQCYVRVNVSAPYRTLTTAFSSFRFLTKAISANSCAIFSVAEGLAAARAARFIDSIFFGDFNHELTVSAISFGSLLYFPKPESSTNGMFPSSCPGLLRETKTCYKKEKTLVNTNFNFQKWAWAFCKMTYK